MGLFGTEEEGGACCALCGTEGGDMDIPESAVELDFVSRLPGEGELLVYSILPGRMAEATSYSISTTFFMGRLLPPAPGSKFGSDGIEVCDVCDICEALLNSFPSD